MTVAQLITELQQYPPDLGVRVHSLHDPEDSEPMEHVESVDYGTLPYESYLLLTP